MLASYLPDIVTKVQQNAPGQYTPVSGVAVPPSVHISVPWFSPLPLALSASASWLVLLLADWLQQQCWYCTLYGILTETVLLSSLPLHQPVSARGRIKSGVKRWLAVAGPGGLSGYQLIVSVFIPPSSARCTRLSLPVDASVS